MEDRAGAFDRLLREAGSRQPLQEHEKDGRQYLYAGMAELVDARDLKSRGRRLPCRFDPGRRQYEPGCGPDKA